MAHVATADEEPRPMTKEEKIVLAVLVGALLMWMTEGYHRINSGVVAVSAMCTLLGVRTMTANDFKNGIEWPARPNPRPAFGWPSFSGLEGLPKNASSVG